MPIPFQRIVIIAWVGVAIGTTPVIAAVQVPTTIVSVSLGIDRVDLTLSNQEALRIQLLTPDILRMQFAYSGQFSTRTTGAVVPRAWLPASSSTDSSSAAVFLVGTRIKVIVAKSPFSITILRSDNSIVLQTSGSPWAYDASTGLSRLSLLAAPGEHFLGFGERPGPVDRRGRRLVFRNSDSSGFGEFTDPLYISIPYYYGFRENQTYGVFLDNAAQPAFDLDSTGQGKIDIGAQSGDLDLYVFSGPAPSDVAKAYALLTGYTPLPPKWALGFHMSRYGYASQDDVLNVAATFRKLQIPCDAIWFDIDYMDRRRQFSWDPVGFPSPERLLHELDGDGFERVSIIEPSVRIDDPIIGEIGSAPFFLSDSKRNTLVNNIFYGDVSWYDYTLSPFRLWYKRRLQSFIGDFISGIWNDLDEPAQNFMPEAIYDFDGQRRTDLEARNLYALNSTSLSYEALLEARPNVRPWVISRSGFSGVQRYSANWGGDSNSTFDALKYNIQMSVAMGLSGQNFFGHDIGGFLGTPSPELILRWQEFSLFTPLYRNHSINTVPRREPWLLPDGLQQIAKTLIERRYRMLPYIYSLMELASRTGQPALAPAAFWFPADAATFQMDTEFFLGPQMLVAPVYLEGASTRTVHLPAGTDWIDTNTDLLYVGGRDATVSAGVGTIPVFVRAGSVIPGASVIQNVRTQPLEVTTDFYPGAPGAFSVYEDDGRSFEYRTGSFRRTQLNYTPCTSEQVIVITRDVNGWTPPPRFWILTLHRMTKAPMQVTVNGHFLRHGSSSPPLVAQNAHVTQERGEWTYDATAGRLSISFPDQASEIDVKVRN